MRFATLGSGSAGNATLLARGDEGILIDCGLSLRQVERRLELLGFPPERMRAVLITHEHADHVAGAGAFSRKYRVPLHLTAGTRQASMASLADAHACIECVPGAAFSIGSFNVEPVIVPHDAREPCQFIIGDASSRIGVLTDVGQITPHLLSRFRALDALVLEFNHEPALLAASQYPPGLKSRIAGPHGHLSNGQAETMLARMDGAVLRHVVAAHLSEKTNTRAHVEACLVRQLPAHVSWHIASQHAPLPWCEFDPRAQ